jgi:hypothetical protein
MTNEEYGAIPWNLDDRISPHPQHQVSLFQIANFGIPSGFGPRVIRLFNPHFDRGLRR